MIVPNSHNTIGFNRACMKFEDMVKGDRILKQITSQNPNIRYVFSFVAAYRYIKETLLNPTSTKWFNDTYKSYVSILDQQIKNNDAYHSIFTSYLEVENMGATFFDRNPPEYFYNYFMKHKKNMEDCIDYDDNN